MDNSSASQWGPGIGAIAGVALAGLVMLVGCVTVTTDPPGRILTGIAAAGLLIFAAGSWRGRPKLALADGALVYRGWFRTRRLHHADIDTIRVTQFRRWGRNVRLLEIDTTSGQLFVLSRWDLGGDPLSVLDALTDAGYAPHGGR